MARGGGQWLVQNKVLPGTYINFISRARAMATLGVRGIVGGVMNMNWGEQGKIVSITSQQFQTNALNLLGYSFVANENLYFREAFLKATRFLYYRPRGGTAARVSIGNTDFVAIYNGTRGNEVQISVEADPDSPGYYYVTTLVYDGGAYAVNDEQRIKDGSEFRKNSFVEARQRPNQGEQPNWAFEETLGTHLTGGTNPTITGSTHSNFLRLIEKEHVTTIFFSGNHPITKMLYAAFTRRVRDQKGIKITCVLHDYTRADHEGILSVENKVIPNDIVFTDLDTAMVYWTAGAQAGCAVNRSLTNTTYNGSLTVDTENVREPEDALNRGYFTFVQTDDNQWSVLRDINTFTSFKPTKNDDFSSNQVIRVLDEIGNGIARVFNTFYLGQVQNNELGRKFLTGDIISFMEQMQSIEAIENFDPDTDINIGAGRRKHEVASDMQCQPVVAMEKLYMRVMVV